MSINGLDGCTVFAAARRPARACREKKRSTKCFSNSFYSWQFSLQEEREGIFNVAYTLCIKTGMILRRVVIDHVQHLMFQGEIK